MQNINNEITELLGKIFEIRFSSYESKKKNYVATLRKSKKEIAKLTALRTRSWKK